MNLPAFDLKCRSAEEQIQIFDEFRQKYVQLTPEEWVRQHFAHFMVTERAIPKSLLKLEFQINYHRQHKRPDIGVLDKTGGLFALVECKKPQTELTQEVFYQIATYASVMNPRYLLITNGIQHIYSEYRPELEKFAFLDEFPSYT